MRKLDSINQVREFHMTFNAPVLESPLIPSKDRADLRVSLLQEELDELKDSIANGDLIGVADALADLQYVLHGAVLEFGLGQKFVDIFDEVHRSNMSKACTSNEVADDTIRFYKEKDGTESFKKEVGDKIVVYRNSDNKVLKSVKYTPANIEKIIKS